MTNQGNSGGLNETNLAVVVGCLGGVLILMLVGLVFLLREKNWCCFRQSNSAKNNANNKRRAAVNHSRQDPIASGGLESNVSKTGELRLIEGDEHQAMGFNNNNTTTNNHRPSAAAYHHVPGSGPPGARRNSSRLMTQSARRRELERANGVGPNGTPDLAAIRAGGNSPPNHIPHPNAAAGGTGGYYNGPTTLLDMAAAAASNTQPITPSPGQVGLQPLALNCLQVNEAPKVADHSLPAKDMGDLTRGAAYGIMCWRDEVVEIMERINASSESHIFLDPPVPDDPWYQVEKRPIASPRPSDARSETMSVASSQDPYYSGQAGLLRSPVVSDLSDQPRKDGAENEVVEKEQKAMTGDENEQKPEAQTLEKTGQQEAVTVQRTDPGVVKATKILQAPELPALPHRSTSATNLLAVETTSKGKADSIVVIREEGGGAGVDEEALGDQTPLILANPDNDGDI